MRTGDARDTLESFFFLFDFVKVGEGAFEFALKMADAQKAFDAGEKFKFIDGLLTKSSVPHSLACSMSPVRSGR